MSEGCARLPAVPGQPGLPGPCLARRRPGRAEVKDPGPTQQLWGRWGLWAPEHLPHEGWPRETTATTPCAETLGRGDRRRGGDQERLSRSEGRRE